MLRLLLAVVAVACSGCLVREVRGGDGTRPEVTLQSLEGDLAGQGAWVDLPALGRAWQPAEAFAGSAFFPYGTGGRWLLTDAGWVFDSEHAFGWATYHYGRWSLEADYGWVWLPGTAWAPAWVAWRTGPRAIGWAPLGPEGAPPLAAARWSFIEPRHLGAKDPRLGALPGAQFDEAALQTRPAFGEAASSGPTPAQLGAGGAPRPRALASVSSAARPSRVIPWRRGTTAEVRVVRSPPALGVALGPGTVATQPEPLARGPGAASRPTLAAVAEVAEVAVAEPVRAAPPPLASSPLEPERMPPSVGRPRPVDRLKVR